MKPAPAPKVRQGQRGSAAVEFAFVFPFLFMLVYGVIVYAYVFIVHESMNFAVQEAAEAAVAVDPETAGYTGAVETRVRSMALAVLGWMPQDQQDRLMGASGQNVGILFTTVDGHDALQVTLTMPLQEPQLLPIVNFPLVGPIPRLPDAIVARATVLL